MAVVAAIVAAATVVKYVAAFVLLFKPTTDDADVYQGIITSRIKLFCFD